MADTIFMEKILTFPQEKYVAPSNGMVVCTENQNNFSFYCVIISSDNCKNTLLLVKLR